MAMSAALVLLLAVLFVFPGFVAAGFSRAGVGFMEIFPGDDWSITGPTILVGGGPPRSLRAETLFARAVLCPAYQVMKRSDRMREFYEWEFRLAGGLSFGISA